jgi:hypothetical protein
MVSFRSSASLSPEGVGLGGAQSGVRIVKFGGSALEHRYYALEELPERIE